MFRLFKIHLNKIEIECEKTNLIDRISQLPNTLIVKILSRLTTTDALRINILSSHCKYIWTSIVCLGNEFVYPQAMWITIILVVIYIYIYIYIYNIGVLRGKIKEEIKVRNITLTRVIIHYFLIKIFHFTDVELYSS